MKRLPPGFRAIVFGASGALGGAFAGLLRSRPACAEVVALSRATTPAFDLTDEASIRACAATLADRAPFHLLIDATGALTLDGVRPEKRLDDVEAVRLSRAFAVNAIGPALLMKHFVPLLPRRERCIFATLSARVGSIADNRKGGWYGYRASKAALNMLLRTAAIEACRTRPEAVFVALQPGTVRSRLSAAFVAGDDALAPEASAAMLLDVLDAAPAQREALFLDHRGHAVPW